ncbi:MAG TPA: deoxyribodipyrimidine photo-lyase, partial [Spirochaetota bacterium]|nr:deoxyribodipyrimidine photo-lyase [Spirochaetota bacterium]
MIRTDDSPKALFIFNRNLRLEDNPAFVQAAACGLPVITAFIFNPRQIEPHGYRSPRALRFMIESLEDLAARISSRGGRLLFFHGDPASVVERLIREHTVRHVFT